MHIDSLKFESYAYGDIETRAERLLLNRNSSETLKLKRKSRTVPSSTCRLSTVPQIPIILITNPAKVYGYVETRTECMWRRRNSNRTSIPKQKSSDTLKFQRKSRTVPNSESHIRFSMDSACFWICSLVSAKLTELFCEPLLDPRPL